MRFGRGTDVGALIRRVVVGALISGTASGPLGNFCRCIFSGTEASAQIRWAAFGALISGTAAGALIR